MCGVDLEIDGRGAGSRGDPACRPQQRPPDAAPALRRLHVKLLEPRRSAAVLQRPDEGERGKADRPPADRRDEEPSALGIAEDAVDRAGKPRFRRPNTVLAELRDEKLDQAFAVAAPGGADVRDE